MTFLAELATILETSEKNAAVRASKLRIMPKCNRCLGSGQYSFNGTHSTCYGCNGAGSRMPKAAEELDVLEDAVACKADGRFATYMAALAARAASKNATQRVMDAWKATGVSALYSWQNAAAHVRTGEFKRDRDIADINKKMSVAFTAVSEYKGETKSDAGALAFAATVEASLAAVAAAKEELDAYLAANPL